MERRPAWFAPKRYGYGAGLPIAWQGWAAITLVLLLLTGALRSLHGVARPLACGALIAAFAVLAALKTEGGGR